MRRLWVELRDGRLAPEKKLEFLNFPLLALVAPSAKGGRIEDLVQILAAISSSDSIII